MFNEAVFMKQILLGFSKCVQLSSYRLSKNYFWNNWKNHRLKINRIAVVVVVKHLKLLSLWTRNEKKFFSKCAIFQTRLQHRRAAKWPVSAEQAGFWRMWGWPLTYFRASFSVYRSVEGRGKNIPRLPRRVPKTVAAISEHTCLVVTQPCQTGTWTRRWFMVPEIRLVVTDFRMPIK